MPLSIGTKLGSYEIVAPLGAGGMGEVYRGRDTQLDREVAIKILPQAMASDPQRLVRFEREAKVLASLNHPNIAAIYGLAESGGVRALVMELVPGKTLHRPVPVEEAVSYAKQVAEALEAAHEKGIIHRDLKPANIMITPEGVVKVLDFGLASTPQAPGDGVGNTSDSPTMTMAATQAGVIMGTAAYMSPEQAAGKTVDKRADIWSFGVVLWEMLSGARMFDGETVSHTLADVLRAPIDFDKIPKETPRAIRELLRRCLERDAKKRLRDIGEARIAIEEALTQQESEPAPPLPARRKRAILPWAIAAVFGVCTTGLAFLHFRQRPPQARVISAALLPPDGAEFDFSHANLFAGPALSPDGTRVVFGATSKDGKILLWMRRLDANGAQPLPNTENAMFPFWSPDSRWIGFGQNGKLKKIDLQGGPPVTVCDFPGDFRGGSWSPQGVIVFGTNAGKLLRVPEAGGTPAPAGALQSEQDKGNQVFPWFLPDGHHYLYTLQKTGDIPVGIGSLDEPGKPSKVVVARANSNAVYAQGHLLYLRDNTLVAQPFDSDRLETTGEAIPLAEGVTTFTQPSRAAGFTVSSSGLLVYQSGAASGQRIVWRDRQGKELGNLGEPITAADYLALSPDGRRLAAGLITTTTSHDLWIYDVARGIPTRFTFNPATSALPIWSPDANTIYFTSDRHGALDLFRKASNGASDEEILLADSSNKYPDSVSPDGKLLMYERTDEQTFKRVLWVLPLGPAPAGGKPKPRVFLQAPFNEVDGVFSPDGRWVAYCSDESGQLEVYMTPFPGPGGKRQISAGGGRYPRWRRDGKELFYLAGPRSGQQLNAAELIAVNGTLQVQRVEKLFDGIVPTARPYDVSADGQRFAVVNSISQTSVPPLTLVENWPASLRK